MIPAIKKILIALTMSLSLIPATVALADSGTGLPVVLRPCDAQGNQLNGPGYWVLTAQPGSTTHLYALVGNKSHLRAVVRVLSVDAMSGVYGGITAALPTQPRHMVGGWLHLSTRRLTLDPYRAMIVPFTLHVPAHTKPGQYIGALTAFAPATRTQRGRGFAFTVQTRLADYIVITVPGPQSWRFSLSGVSAHRGAGGVHVIVHVRNSGSMMLKGWGYLRVWQPGRSRPVIAKPLALDTTVPHSMVNYPVWLGKRSARGRYACKVKIWWNGGRAVQRGSFWVR